MPIWTDSRGVGVYISDEDAREHANHLLTDLHRKLNAAEEYGTRLDDADLFAYHEAERLLSEVGDVANTSVDTSGDSYIDPCTNQKTSEDEDQHEGPPSENFDSKVSAKRREQRRQTAELVARTYLQIEGAASEIGMNLSRSQKDVVRVRRDREHDEWIVTGRGTEYHVRDEGTAEREAKRRAGWTT